MIDLRLGRLSRRDGFPMTSPGLTRAQALAMTPELAGRPRAELHRLLTSLDDLRVAPGCRLAGEGRSLHQYVVLLEGRLRATSTDGGCRLLTPGESFGWEAMMVQGPSPASLVADSEARVLVAGHEQFRALKEPAEPGTLSRWLRPLRRAAAARSGSRTGPR